MSASQLVMDFGELPSFGGESFRRYSAMQAFSQCASNDKALYFVHHDALGISFGLLCRTPSFKNFALLDKASVESAAPSAHLECS